MQLFRRCPVALPISRTARRRLFISKRKLATLFCFPSALAGKMKRLSRNFGSPGGKRPRKRPAPGLKPKRPQKRPQRPQKRKQKQTRPPLPPQRKSPQRPRKRPPLLTSGIMFVHSKKAYRFTEKLRENTEARTIILLSIKRTGSGKRFTDTAGILFTIQGTRLLLKP